MNIKDTWPIPIYLLFPKLGLSVKLEWCGLFSGVKTFNFKSIYLVSFEGSSRGLV